MEKNNNTKERFSMNFLLNEDKNKPKVNSVKNSTRKNVENKGKYIVKKVDGVKYMTLR